MKKVVFLRHGQSQWNLENRFTGWVDVDLSPRGIDEARQAGQLLKSEGYRFDVAYTSLLKRAIRTLWLTLDEMDQMYLSVHADWRINERHYGALQGLDKKETVAKHGEDQVLRWRRGFAIQPPAMDENDPGHPRFDPRYAKLDQVPATESLADTIVRVRHWWDEVLAPALLAGANPIVTAHGNSMRAIVKLLDNVSEDAIIALNIPTGVPLVYEFDDALKPLEHYYLGDQAAIEAAVNEVANQTARSPSP